MEISFKLCLPRDGASVPVVRHVCRDALVRLGVEDGCIADIELAVSEACANVLHTADGSKEYEVQVKVTDTLCVIRVIDAGQGFDHSMHGIKSSPETAESGRGIFLMRALVDDLTFMTTDGAGTEVYLRKNLVLRPDSPLSALTV